jgi:hypothetical protein
MDATLECTGSVRLPTRFGYVELLQLLDVYRRDIVGVEVIELFAAVGLRSEADVAVFANAKGAELAVPIRALTDGNAVLRLGRRTAAPPATDRMSFFLELNGWTVPNEPFEPVSIHVLPFWEFVGCR